MGDKILNDLFTRGKTATVYEHDKSLIDVVSGEIVSQTSEKIKKTSTEPDFIKVYYNAMLAFHNVQGIPLDFIMAVSRHLTWANDETQMTFTVNQMTRDQIMEACGIKRAQFSRYVKTCTEYGIFFKTEYRGIYIVNPFLIAKGKWDKIRQLRTEFNYIEGKWVRANMIDEEPIAGTEEI